jgi:hypothetical protein
MADLLMSDFIASSYELCAFTIADLKLTIQQSLISLKRKVHQLINQSTV